MTKCLTYTFLFLTVTACTSRFDQTDLLTANKACRQNRGWVFVDKSSGHPDLLDVLCVDGTWKSLERGEHRD